MRICFVNCRSEGSYVPLATPYLASYLISKGYNDISIIDHKDPISEIKKINPDIIGFNMFSGNYYEVNKIGGEVRKQFPNIPLIAGGPHIYCMPQQIKTSNFDIGATGEGEETMLELVKIFERLGSFPVNELEKVDGIIFKDKKGDLIQTKPRKLIPNIDDIPFPAIHLLDMKGRYTIPGPAGINLIGRRAYIVTSRGCPYNCTFCASRCIWNRVRWHSAERTVSDIMHWVTKYKANFFYVYDDLIIANIPRLKKIIELLKKEGILGKIEFEILGRANLITDESCRLLKELNATIVDIGFESGSERMLKYLKGDNVSITDNIKAIDLVHRYGMEVGGMFIIGSPTETEEDIKQTYELASNKKLDVINVNVAVPFPGTEFWTYAIKNKIYPPNFFELGLEITPTIPNFDYMLTKEISKDKLITYYNEFQKIITAKEKTRKHRFKLSDIKFFFHMGLLKKLYERKKLLPFYMSRFFTNIFKIKQDK